MKNKRFVVWASVSLVSAFFFIIITSLFVLPIVTAQKKQDLLLLRDSGEQISGRLNSLNPTLIQFNKTPFERSKVDIIRFSGATNTAPQPNIQDQVLMRDGRLLLGYISQIDSRTVIQKGKRLNKSQVALIKLAVKNDSSNKDKGNKDGTTFGDTTGGKPKDTASVGGVPPWDKDISDCQFRGKIHMGPSGGSPYRYDEKGSPKELFPSGSGLITCNFNYYVCGDHFFKGKVININKGEKCPEWGVEYKEVCCDNWVKAKLKKSTCNPMLDSDCDGVSNQEDDYPTDSSRSKIPSQ